MGLGPLPRLGVHVDFARFSNVADSAHLARPARPSRHTPSPSLGTSSTLRWKRARRWSNPRLSRWTKRDSTAPVPQRIEPGAVSRILRHGELEPICEIRPAPTDVQPSSDRARKPIVAWSRSLEARIRAPLTDSHGQSPLRRAPPRRSSRAPFGHSQDTIRRRQDAGDADPPAWTVTRRPGSVQRMIRKPAVTVRLV